MPNDLDKYPLYELIYGKLVKLRRKKFKTGFQWHHFIEKTIRKNNPEFYERVEHLQKMILIPAFLNYSIGSMREERFKKLYGLEKHEVLFNRKLWRAGVYDKGVENEQEA